MQSDTLFDAQKTTSLMELAQEEGLSDTFEVEKFDFEEYEQSKYQDSSCSNDTNHF